MIWLTAVIAYLLVVYFGPIAWLLRYALEGGGGSLLQVLGSSVTRSILVNTLTFAAAITILTLLFSYPIAYFAATSHGRTRNALLLVSTIPLWTSLLVRSVAWLIVLARHGPVNEILLALGLISEPLNMTHNTVGFYVSSLYILVPTMVLVLFASMRGIDPAHVKSARTLGAHPLQAFLNVYVPLSIPAVVSGCLLVFIIALGFFVTPSLLGGPSDRQFSMLIQQTVDRFADFTRGAALSLVLLICSLACLALFGWVAGFNQFMGGRYRGKSLGSLQRVSLKLRYLDVPLRPLAPVLESRRLWLIVVTITLVFMFVPYIVIIPLSFSDAEYLEFPPSTWSLRWYEEIAGSSRWLTAGITSVVVGGIAAAIAVSLSFVGSLGMRDAPGRVSRVALPLIIAPMLIPSIIYSVGAFMTASTIGLSDTVLGIALAHAALALPVCFILIATAVDGVDPAIERAARSLGASTLTSTRRIMLPLVRPVLYVAALLAFQTSFDEIVVALFMSGVQTRTIPRLMWEGARLEVNPAISAVAVLVLGAILILAVVTGIVQQASLWRRQRVRVEESSQ